MSKVIRPVAYVPSEVRTCMDVYSTLTELVGLEASKSQRIAMKELLEEETNLTLTISHVLETMASNPIFEAKVKEIFDFSKVAKLRVAGMDYFTYVLEEEA